MRIDMALVLFFIASFFGILTHLTFFFNLRKTGIKVFLRPSRAADELFEYRKDLGALR
jgi:hypothetical protein